MGVTWQEQLRESRVTDLKHMHEVMCRMNHEGAYMEWVTFAVPDEPSEDDFRDIAEDDEMYQDCVHTFVNIIAVYGHYGILKKEK